MKTHFSSRILSLTLAFALLLGLVPTLGNLFTMPAEAVNIVKPLGENMFLQGNFEGIDLRDWSTNVSGVTVLNQLSAEAEHSDGTRGLKVVYGTNTNGIRATVYGLTSGATYRLGIWAKAGTTDAAGVKINLHQWTSAWGSDVKSSTVLTTDLTSEWVQYTCDFTMNVNRTIIQFDVIGTAGTVLADDITVVRVADVPCAYLAPLSTESYTLNADLSSAPHTYEGWIEVDGSQSGALIGNYTSTLTESNAYGASYGVQYRDKKLEYWLWGGSGQAPQIRIPFNQLTLPTNEKFHFAIVSDPTADTVTCYINGGTANGGSQQTVTADDYTADTAGLYSWDTWYNGETAKYATLGIAYDVAATRPLRVGGNSTATNLTGTKIYSLAMFDSPRSAEDIVLDMARVPYEDTDLAAAYNFTAYGNERLEDHSANNNHLVYSDGTNTENYDVSGMSFDANVTWTTTETLTAIPTTYVASVNLPADLNDYIPGGIIIGNVGNCAASNNSVFSFEVAAMGQPRVYWNSKLNGKTTLLFDEIDLRTGEWVTVTAAIDTAASTVTVSTSDGQSQTLSYTKALPPFDPYTATDSVGEYQQETGWMPLTVGGDTVDGNVNYFRGKIASVSATYADGSEALSYTLTDTNADGLVANQLWIREVEEPTDYEYSMMTVGDTQTVNWYYPDEFGHIYDYIAEQATAAGGKMAMVMGLGDITEMGTAEEEMQRANEHVSKLDGLVEYSMIRGNHDSPALLEKYFGYARYKDQLGGSYDGSALNTWRTFTAGGVDYLLLTLTYFPTDAQLEWAADIVASHPNHTVIISTHAFLDYKGDLLTNRSINTFVTGPAGDTDTSMWDILIGQYDNIQLVLCGHISNQGVTQTVFPREGMSDVTAMLIDPQGLDASIGATGMVNTLYFGEGKADGTVDIQVVTYSTVRGEYYGSDSQFTTSIKLAPKATATNSGSITLSGDFTLNNSNNVTTVTVPYTGTTTAAAGTRFAGQVTDLSDHSVLNAELVLNADNTVTIRFPTSVAPEQLKVSAGTVFTSFDNTLTLTVAADYSATLLTWVELTPENFHIWGNNYADQANNKRCCIYFYSEDLIYDPGDSKWENFAPQNQPITIDGTSHNALVIGETPNSTGTYPVAIIYLYESTVGFEGILANSEDIVIPAGTEVKSPDGKTGIRFTADVGMKKVNDAWTVYDPSAPAAPSDHGGDTALSDNAVGAGMQNGNFGATTGQNWVGNSSIVDGMAKIEVSGTDDYIQFNGNTAKAGVEYTLAFYVWVTEASSDFHFNIYFTDAGSPAGGWLDYALGSAKVTSNISGGIKGVTNGWQYVTVKWTAPADGGVTFGLKNYGSAATGVVYIDDVSLTYEPVITYYDIDFDIETDVVSSLGYNTNDKRTYLVVQSASTLPIANWSTYKGSTALLIDGVEVTASAAGANNANQMQIYVVGNTTDFSSTATEITIPQGTEFYDGNYNIVRFTKDFTIVKENNRWIKKPKTLDVAISFGSVASDGTWYITADLANATSSYYRVKATIDGAEGYIALQRKDTQFVVWPNFFPIYGLTAPTESLVIAKNAIFEPIDPNTTGWNVVTDDAALVATTAINRVNSNGIWINASAAVAKQTISIKTFSWAHSGIIGMNMGNYAEISATEWFANYGNGTYFYAKGDVYLDGAETPTSVRIALPAGTNDNIFFYGMPADGEDDDITLVIKEGAEFTSEKGDVILVFDKEYIIDKTAQNTGTVSEASTKLSGYNVTLSSDMKVGVQITPAAGVSLSDLKLTYTVAGGAAQTAVLADGLFYCNVPAKDMTSELVLTLSNTNSQVQTAATATTTLRDYALKLLTGDQTDKVKTAAKAMLNYGAAAQSYFGYHTGSPANTDYAYTQAELDAADPGEVSGVHADVDTQPAAYVGASLLLQSKTGIRLYFSENVGGNLTYHETRQLYYYEFSGIGAGNLATEQSVTLDGVTYTVSVLSMAREVIDGSKYSEEFKNLMKAITLYYDAASAL